MERPNYCTIDDLRAWEIHIRYAVKLTLRKIPPTRLVKNINIKCKKVFQKVEIKHFDQFFVKRTKVCTRVNDFFLKIVIIMH